jgi:hypothetical protein
MLFRMIIRDFYCVYEEWRGAVHLNIDAGKDNFISCHLKIADIPLNPVKDLYQLGVIP